MHQNHKIIHQAEDYIESHLQDKILLEDIACSIHLSKFHFHRLFVQYTSETIQQFITRIKMERSAIVLVLRGDLSISDIAYRYGYSEASAYSRAFKRYYRMSPLQYKRARKVNT